MGKSQRRLHGRTLIAGHRPAISKPMTFRPVYALATVLVFVIEVLIALYMHDAFIRPYGGDILAVILVYLGLRAVTPMGVRSAVLLALLIAFAIEFGQLFHVLDHLGLGRNRLLRVVLGGVFDLKDLACYVAGAVLAGVVEMARKEIN